MNKIIIIAAAGAALAAYLINRRRSLKPGAEPALLQNTGKTQKHLTNVFSRAKRQAQGSD
jgi:hypothetical protein